MTNLLLRLGIFVVVVFALKGQATASAPHVRFRE